MTRRRLWLVRFLFMFFVFLGILLFVSRGPLWWRLAVGPAMAGVIFATVGVLLERRRQEPTT